MNKKKLLRKENVVYGDNGNLGSCSEIRNE